MRRRKTHQSLEACTEAPAPGGRSGGRVHAGADPASAARASARLNLLPNTCWAAAGSSRTAATAARSTSAQTSGAALTAGRPPSAMGDRTVRADFLSRDTGSTTSSSPTAVRTTATGFRRSPGGTWTESGRTAQAAVLDMV